MSALDPTPAREIVSEWLLDRADLPNAGQALDTADDLLAALAAGGWQVVRQQPEPARMVLDPQRIAEAICGRVGGNKVDK